MWEIEEKDYADEEFREAPSLTTAAPPRTTDPSPTTAPATTPPPRTQTQATTGNPVVQIIEPEVSV